MKKFYFLIVFVLFGYISSAQIVDTVNLQKHPEVKYIDIGGTWVSQKLMVQADYGQPRPKGMFPKPPFVRDENGQVINFNGMMEALSMFDKWGWELVTLYLFTGDNTYHYLLKRKS